MRVVPELQDIAVGTFIPDGPPETECGLDVVHLERERALVLRSNSHLPKTWRSRARLDWTWAFTLTPIGEGTGTRYHFRSRWVTRPWWLSAGGRLVLVPADFVMSHDMLKGVKSGAEKLWRAHPREARHALGRQDVETLEWSPVDARGVLAAPGSSDQRLPAPQRIPR